MLALSVTLIAAVVPPVLAASSVSAATAASIAFVSPAASSGEPGVSLSPAVVVQLTGDGTTALSTSPVVLKLTRTGDASGSLACDAGVTNADGTISDVPDADGRASFPGCKVDKGGTYTLVAKQGDLTASTPLVISGPAVLSFTTQPGGAEAGLALAAQPVLQVSDAAGAAVTGDPQRVALVLAPGPDTAGAVLSCGATNIVSTNSQGVATFTGCAVDRPGTYKLLAYAERDKVAGTSAEFTIGAGQARALRFRTEPVGGAAGGIAVQPVVAVVDAGGNTVTGSTAAVSLAVTGSSGTTVSCAATTTVAGEAAFTGCSVSSPGTYTLTATATGLTSATSAGFTVVAGGLASLAFTAQPGGGAGGQTFGTQPVVKLRDAGGAPTTGVVTLTLSGGSAGASLHCDSNPAVSVGDTVSFKGCRVDAVGDDYVLTATSSGVTVRSAPFDVTAGQIAALRITAAPATAVGGSPFADVKVEATDIGGNRAAGSVRLSRVPDLGTEGAVLDCAGTRATTNGIATFAGCAIDLAGIGYRLQATVDGAPTAIDTTEAFDVSVGPAHHLAFRTAPGGGTGGTAWAQQPVVAVEDAGGNRIVGSTAVIDLTLSGAGGTLACTSDPLPVTSGAAVFAGCAVDRTGTYRLTASAGTLSGSSASFSVAAGPATQLLFTQQPQRGAPAAALSTQPRVTVADAGGNPAAGVLGAVALSLTPGTGIAGAALSCPAATVSGGVAGFSGCRVANAGGGYTFTASFNGLRAESLPFNVVPAAPAAVGKAPTGVPAGQTFGGRLYANNPTTVQDSVNTATGSLQTSVVDLEVAGVGQDLLLERTYNSADLEAGAFGPGWSSVLDLAVAVNAAQTQAVVRGEDGQRVVFTRAKPTSAWTAPPGARASLTCSTKSCTVLRDDGTSFEVAGTQLVSYLDANGQGLRFEYEAGQLRRVLVATKDPKTPQVVTLTTAGGRVTSLRSPAGRTVSYAYTAGLLTGVTDVLGKAWAYAQVANRLSRITDPDGAARLAVSYAADGRVVSVIEGGSARRADTTFTWALTNGTGTSTRQVATDGGRASYVDQYLGNVLVRQDLPAGATLRYGYDAQVNLTHVQDPAGWVQVMAYDLAGHLLSQSNPLGNGAAAVVRMTYDAQHRITSQTDPNGRLVTYVYNGPNLGSVRPPGAGEGATRLFYDNLGLLQSVTTPLGTQVFTNDAYGNQIRTVDQDLAGLSLTGAGSTSTFDEAGHRTGFTSALGIASSWRLDAAGKTLTATTPTGTVDNTYSPAGTPLSSTSFGETTRYAWDEAALTRTTTSPAGTTVQVYDRSGNVLRETAPNGLVTQHAYDGVGREVVTTTGASSIRYTFDDASNVVLAADSDGAEVRKQFDTLNRPVRQVSDGLETRTSYDAGGNVTATRDASGGITTRSYDGHGNPSAVSDGSGTTSYRYDLADNVVGRTDGRGGITTWTYDAMSRATSMSVADRRTTYEHDLDSRLVKTTDPVGRSTTLTLDRAGNALLTAYRGTGYAPVDVQQTFDGRGRRTSLNGVPVTYDARGNMTGAAGFSYDYATPGTVVETYPGGKRISYGVDGSGNLMSVR
ncbi:MAG: hypothetical protein JWL64_256, partial [Frankiales bacterium]|nr:hypothetical protein [Frankiales bacterium]